MKKKHFQYLIFFFFILIIKLTLILQDNKQIDFYDETLNFQIAQNYLQGNDYSVYKAASGQYKLSAFHISSSVFLYKFLIEHNVSQKEIEIAFFAISTLLYLVAVCMIYQILLLLQVSDTIAAIASVFFALYPSVIYGLGTKYHFDNIVMPLSLINIYWLLKWMKGYKQSLLSLLLLIANVSLCCFLRSQIVFVYLVIMLLLLYWSTTDSIRKKQWNYKMPLVITAVLCCIFLVYLPTLVKNKKMFGSYILSTQAGFEFLQGHNPVTNGNWITPRPKSALQVYIHQKMPAIDSLNEYQQSKVEAQMALDWIKQNPVNEVKYIFKKAIRYFVPENGAPLHMKPFFQYHPFTAILHVIFFIVVYGGIKHFKKFVRNRSLTILTMPILATLLLSIIFYFDLKLRFNADPYMIIITAFGIDAYLRQRQQKNNLTLETTH